MGKIQQSKRRKTTIKKKQRLERLKKSYAGKLPREKKKPLIVKVKGW
jgi:hypothetical protein